MIRQLLTKSNDVIILIVDENGTDATFDESRRRGFTCEVQRNTNKFHFKRHGMKGGSFVVGRHIVDQLFKKIEIINLDTIDAVARPDVPGTRVTLKYIAAWESTCNVKLNWKGSKIAESMIGLIDLFLQ